MMKILIIIASLLLLPAICWAQDTSQNTAGQLTPNSVASLPNPPAKKNAVRYVMDGTIGSVPCTGGGTGTIAFWTGSQWNCGVGGGGGGTPGGADKQVQVNNAGAFGANANFTFNLSTNLLTLNGGFLGVNGTFTGELNSCADAGATDSYACSLSPAPAAYVTDQAYWFKANTPNTGAATINFNSLGAKTIKKLAGGITTDLADNDIRAGQWVELRYDGTNMQMLSALGNAPVPGAAGSNTQINYNKAGNLAGDSGLVYNDTTKDETLGGGLTTGTVSGTSGCITQSGTTSGSFKICAQDVAGNFNGKWPTVDGTLHQRMETDGAGNLSFTSGPYDLATQVDGAPTSSQVVLRFKAGRAFTLSGANHVCSAGTAATAQTDFIVAVNGTTKDTLRFAASGTTCSIVGGTQTSIAVNDLITITAPGSADATLANVAFFLFGTYP